MLARRAAFAAAPALAYHVPLLTGDPELLLPDAPWAHEDLRNRSPWDALCS